MVTALLAVDESRLSSMMVFFFIALLIVSPFGYRRIRQVMAARRGDRPPEVERDAPTVSPVAPDDLARVVGDVDAAASAVAADRSARPTVTVPARPTIDGRPAAPEVARAVVDDAVHRSGLVATRHPTDDGGEVLTLRPR